MADILEYCLQKKIMVKNFCHTLAPYLSHFFERIFTSQKFQKSIEKFILTYDRFSLNVDNVIQISNNVKDIKLTDKISLGFLCPPGQIYDLMSKRLGRKVNVYPISYGDLNKLAPIILIENDQYGALITSDAVKKNFKNLKKKISQKLVLIQVPHHGSWTNIFEDFWDLDKIDNCPAIFSIGDEPKDKLPDVKTVDFFHKKGFSIYSTNYVYGIKDYFEGVDISSMSTRKSVWDNFSKKVSSTNQNIISTKFQGNQRFNLFI